MDYLWKKTSFVHYMNRNFLHNWELAVGYYKLVCKELQILAEQITSSRFSPCDCFAHVSENELVQQILIFEETSLGSQGLWIVLPTSLCKVF
jgi:hypothetical protein